MKRVKLKILSSKPKETLDTTVGFRMRKSVKARFYAQLEREGSTPQRFWNEIVEAYLEGKFR